MTLGLRQFVALVLLMAFAVGTAVGVLPPPCAMAALGDGEARVVASDCGCCPLTSGALQASGEQSPRSPCDDGQCPCWSREQQSPTVLRTAGNVLPLAVEDAARAMPDDFLHVLGTQPRAPSLTADFAPCLHTPPLHLLHCVIIR